MLNSSRVTDLLTELDCVNAVKRCLCEQTKYQSCVTNRYPSHALKHLENSCKTGDSMILSRICHSPNESLALHTTWFCWYALWTAMYAEYHKSECSIPSSKDVHTNDVHREEERRVSLITCKPHSNITAQTALKKPDQTLLGNHKDRLIGVFGVVESRSPPPETNANSLDVYTPHTSTCRKQTYDLQVPLSWCSITYSFNWGRRHSQEWGGEAQVTADSATHHCP